MKLKEQAKAITGGVLAGLLSLGGALADGQVIPLEWVAVAVAAVGTYGGVYRIPQSTSLAKLPHLSADELFRLAERAQDQERAERGRQP